MGLALDAGHALVVACEMLCTHVTFSFVEPESKSGVLSAGCFFVHGQLCPCLWASWNFRTLVVMRAGWCDRCARVNVHLC